MNQPMGKGHVGLFAYHKPLWNWNDVRQLSDFVNGGPTLHDSSERYLAKASIAEPIVREGTRRESGGDPNPFTSNMRLITYAWTSRITNVIEFYYRNIGIQIQ